MKKSINQFEATNHGLKLKNVGVGLAFYHYVYFAQFIILRMINCIKIFLFFSSLSCCSKTNYFFYKSFFLEVQNFFTAARFNTRRFYLDAKWKEESGIRKSAFQANHALHASRGVRSSLWKNSNHFFAGKINDRLHLVVNLTCAKKI